MKKIVITSLISLFISLPVFAYTDYYSSSNYHHRHRIVCKSKHTRKKSHTASRHVRHRTVTPVPRYRTSDHPSYPVPRYRASDHPSYPVPRYRASDHPSYPVPRYRASEHPSYPVPRYRASDHPSYPAVPVAQPRRVYPVAHYPTRVRMPVNQINAMPIVPTRRCMVRWTPWRCNPCQLIYIGVYGGYGIIRGAYSNDGDFAQQRLALGVHGPTYRGALALGAELGVQSGNDMRLDADPAIVAANGGPIQSTLKPFVDALVTLRFQGPNNPFFGFIKGGVAYRQLQLNNVISQRADALRKIDPEAQAGIGINISEHASVTLFYQGIYAGTNTGLTINNAGETIITRIPTQQAGFLGMEFSL